MRREPDDYGWVVGLVVLAGLAQVTGLPWTLAAGALLFGGFCAFSIVLPEVRIARAQRRLRREEAAASARRAPPPEAVPNPADFSRLELVGADLAGRDLRQARLRGTDLHHADLRGANLAGADLVGADLCGANLEGAVLEGADLHWAIYDRRTRWPQGYQPRAHGCLMRARARRRSEVVPARPPTEDEKSRNLLVPPRR